MLIVLCFFLFFFSVRRSSYSLEEKYQNFVPDTGTMCMYCREREFSSHTGVRNRFVQRFDFFRTGKVANTHRTTYVLSQKCGTFIYHGVARCVLYNMPGVVARWIRAMSAHRDAVVLQQARLLLLRGGIVNSTNYCW